jgi:hypothetical protein
MASHQSGVFISYRRSDAPGHAGRLRDALVLARPSLPVFMDVDSIRPGSDFAASIDRALDDTSLVLVIMGPTWATTRDSAGQLRLHDPDDFVRREVAAALGREVLTIPVLVGGASMPAAAELPPELRNLAYREAFELRDSRWGRDVADLTAYLDGVVALPKTRRLGTPPHRRPWVAITAAAAILVLVAVVVLVTRLTGSDADPVANPTETPTTTAPAPTTPAPTPTGDSATTKAAGSASEKPGLRQVFTGIAGNRCNDTTGSWPGVDDFDAKLVIGCDFPKYKADFHQWLNGSEMRRYESSSYRSLRSATKRNTHWRTDDGRIGGDYYVFEVNGGYELLWTIDELLMSGRMFAAVDDFHAIEKLWASDAGVRMDKQYLS